MHSAFEIPLKLKDGVVEACGELGWDDPETEAVVMAVIVRQGGRQRSRRDGKLTAELLEVG